MRQASARLRESAGKTGPEMAQALDAFERRLALLEAGDVDLETAEFSGEFGRNLEYYTGFVFEIVVPSLGEASPVAGGGRYDSLMRLAGAPLDMPAVGAAIHTERLLAAIAGEPA
jgi:ATP phosphoribosyltransferase regulatory subunit